MTTATKPTVASLNAQVAQLTALVTQLTAAMAASTITTAQHSAAAPVADPRFTITGNKLGDRTYKRPILALCDNDASAFALREEYAAAYPGAVVAVGYPVWWTPGSAFPEQVGSAPTHAMNLVAVY